MRKKNNHEEDEKIDRWMISYADFITLLFAFFVVMYALSTINEVKYRTVAEALKTAFSTTVGERQLAPEGVIPELLEEKRSPIVLQTFSQVFTRDFRLIHKHLEILESQGKVSLNVEKRGVVISMMDKVVFDSGSAQIRPDAETVLDDVAAALNEMPNMIKIEGHTDNVPINTAEFPSNWELSSSRALSILKYFINKHNIKPARISATGYGEFRPVAPNDTPDERQKNRRVDIVVLNQEIAGNL